MNLITKTLGLICSLILFCCQIAFGQLKVIEIKGRVSDKTGRYLVVGSVIKDPSQIRFGTFRDEVRVIDKDGKTLSLTPHQHAHIGAQAITGLDLENFDKAEIDLPYIPKSTRIQKLPGDMQSDKAVIIQNSNRYLFDASDFKLGPMALFVLQRNNTYKPLKTLGDTLVIHYEDFLDSARVIGNEQYALFFEQNGDRKEIVKIKPYFDLTNQMGAMIASIVKYYKVKKPNRDSLYSYCLSQVNQTFGKPSSLNFQQAFNKYYYGNYDTTFVPKQHGVKVHIGRSGAIKSQLKPAAGPPAAPGSALVSLRQYAPPPGDQGSSGSCVAWAAAYGAYSLSYNMRHPGPKHAFSPEFIYNQVQTDYRKCVSGEYGITVDAAMQLMTGEGNLIKNDRGFNCAQEITAADIQNAAQYKVLTDHALFSFSVDPLTQGDVDLIKYNVSQLNKPVMIAIFLPARKVVGRDTLATSFDSLYYPPNTGIWQPSLNDYQELQNRADTTLASHEICVVGYNDDINGGSFEVLNSWSDGWGVGGYLWLNYEDFKKFGIDAYVIDGLLNDKVTAAAATVPNKPKVKVTQNKPVHEK